jgi:hypothetical protein
VFQETALPKENAKTLQRCRMSERKKVIFCITQILTRTDEFASAKKETRKLDFENFKKSCLRFRDVKNVIFTN